ncbi:tetratricopeptide repeat protein [Bradyrhizobium sp. MOS003]|uniref:tetratricopeptide repeat protein n=1 Tax=Bradyrhizobium sp. MOS003 TaxID=2133946 RepID=UPI001314876C|nr:tetratricopeptide repeat protein [Bradyrhizobium sp. MOS003]
MIDQKRAEIARLEAQFGPQDLRVADALEEFALWYAANRIYSGAEPYFRRSLQIREGKLGADIRVADGLLRWAKCAEHKGRPEAGELFRRSQEIRESVLGVASVDLLPALEELTDRHLRTFRIKDAVSCQKRCLELVERIHGPLSGETTAKLLRLGKLLLRNGQPTEAEPLLRRALAIHTEMKAPGDARLAALLDALIRTLAAIKQAGEIGPMLQRSLKIKAAVLASEPAKLLEAFAETTQALARYGRVEDLTSLLPDGPATIWPRRAKLLLQFAQRLLEAERRTDASEVAGLAVAEVKRIFQLPADARFTALRELWPDSMDDDLVTQMSDSPDPGDDRLPEVLAWVAMSQDGAHRDYAPNILDLNAP